VFPSCGHSEPVVFGAAVFSASSHVEADAQKMTAVGGLVATHNGSGRSSGAGSINVNTAPVELIEAAMRSSGMGGIEQIIAARAQGKLAVAPHRESLPNKQSNRIQFAAASAIWSFRIDIHVGPLRRSWWATYSRTGRQASGWECIQRLAITE
jgi:hypothetical protein